MSVPAPQYISEQQLEELTLSAQEVVGCIVSMLEQQDQGRAWSVPKSTILPGDGRYLMSTLSALDEPSLMVVKSLVVNPENPKSGLPAINALVTLQDAESGIPLAAMDGNWITAIRTAGISAVAARHLARADSSVIAFVGCGVQARSHLALFAQLFPLAEVRAFGRGRENRQVLCELADSMGLRSVACDDPRDAIASADLIVSSVTLDLSLQPFLDARWIKPGAFAAITDLGLPWLPDQMAKFDQIIIDDLEQELSMEKKMVAPQLVGGDLLELVTGRTAGRGQTEQGDSERTAFIFRGLALGDLALSALVWQKIST